MQMRELRRDEATGLALVVDHRDPPHYYVSAKKRVDLLCIGDAKAASLAFDARVRRAKRKTKPPQP